MDTGPHIEEPPARSGYKFDRMLRLPSSDNDLLQARCQLPAKTRHEPAHLALIRGAFDPSRGSPPQTPWYSGYAA